MDALAELRIQVFREYPYLYEGSLDYERNYLEKYTRSENASTFLVFDGDQVVGASTCLPLCEADKEFQTPFTCQNLSPEQIFYYGESILLPAYRGKGYGKEFFQIREKAARESGRYTWATFCAVNRDPNDPRRPKDYRDLSPFWQRQGFGKRPELTCSFPWKEIGQSEESEQTLTFWVKQL
jgi:GNAT superfamily N-acetyltransferase